MTDGARDRGRQFAEKELTRDSIQKPGLELVYQLGLRIVDKHDIKIAVVVRLLATQLSQPKDHQGKLELLQFLGLPFNGVLFQHRLGLVSRRRRKTGFSDV